MKTGCMKQALVDQSADSARADVRISEIPLHAINTCWMFILLVCVCFVREHPLLA